MESSAQLAHVSVQQPGARFTPQRPAPSPGDAAAAGSNAPNGTVFYDDASRLVVVADVAGSLTRSLLRCHSVPFGPNDRPGGGKEAPFDVVVAPGPVLDVRVSLDVNRAHVAVQRSHVDIEIVQRGGGGGGGDEAAASLHSPSSSSSSAAAAAAAAAAPPAGFTYKLKRSGERILAYFWSTTPKVDFVVVTSLGVEQHQLVVDTGSGDLELKLARSCPFVPQLLHHSLIWSISPFIGPYLGPLVHSMVHSPRSELAVTFTRHCFKRLSPPKRKNVWLGSMNHALYVPR